VIFPERINPAKIESINLTRADRTSHQRQMVPVMVF